MPDDLTTKEKVWVLRLEDPRISASELARRIGVTRERVRQILASLGLPTDTRPVRRAPRPPSSESVNLEPIRAALGALVKTVRLRRDMTQGDAAVVVGVTQPYISKMEQFPGEVPLDIIIRALFALGASKDEVAEAMES